MEFILKGEVVCLKLIISMKTIKKYLIIKAENNEIIGQITTRNKV